MQRASRWLAATAALLVTLAAPACAAAQTADEIAAAKQAFKAGEEAERKGDYASALAKFEAAIAVKSTPQLHLRAGACLEKLGRLVEALAAYERGMQKATGSVPQVAKVAKELIDALKPRIPTVTIAAAKPYPGLTVKIDGVAIEPAALAGPVAVDPGTRRLVAEATGHVAVERSFTIAEGATQRLDVELVPRAEGGVDKRPSKLPGILAIAGGGAALVAGTTVFALSYVKDGAIDELCGSPERKACPRARKAEIDAGVSTANTLRAAGAIVGSVGLVGAVVGTVLLARASRAEAPAASAAWQSRPFVRVAPAGLGAVVFGQF